MAWFQSLTIFLFGVGSLLGLGVGVGDGVGVGFCFLLLNGSP